MNKKIIYISSAVVAAAILIAIAAVAVVRSSRNNETIPNASSASGPTTSAASPSSADSEPEPASSSPAPSASAKNPEISDTDWQKLSKIISCVYYNNFSDKSELSDDICMASLESIINAQSSSGENFMITPNENSEGNYITKSDGDKIINELFGYTVSSAGSYLASGGDTYLFPFAGGSGNPVVTSKTITPIGNNQFKIFCTLKRVNANDEVTYSGSITATVEYIGGEFSDYRFVSLLRTDG